MHRILSKLPRFLGLITRGIFILLCSAGVALASGESLQQAVKGRVVSADDGQGFPGVNIIVKGTSIGTVTDTDGYYSLSVPSNESVLVFTSIGYRTTEIPVAGQSEINLSMDVDVTSLSEVVVVGYGTVKKSDVTGALSSVTSEQLRAVPVQSISQSLQGRAAGVDVAQGSFRPGDNPQIRIRGNRSLLGDNNPLIVLDGIPLPEGSSINDFNPSDVESVEILKDASSSAIYGARAANGVMIVTTKKGKAGKAKVTYDVYYGFSKPLVEIDMFDGGEFAEIRREAQRNNNALTYPFPWADAAADYTAFSPQDIEMWNSVADGYEWVDREARIPKTRPVTAKEREEFEAYYTQYDLRYPVGNPARTAAINTKLTNLRTMLDDPNLEIPVYNPKNVRTTDWGDLALRTGKKQSHQVSVSGGTENMTLYFGAGYYQEKGIQKTQGFERFNVKFGLDYQANKILKVGGTMVGTLSNQDYGSPLYFRSIGQLPIAIPYDQNGNVILQPGGDALIFSPLNEVTDFKDDRRTARFFGSYYADLKIMEGLRYHVNVGTDFRQYRRGQYQGPLTSDRRGGTSWANYEQNQKFTYVIENLLFYDKQLTDDHKIGATGLFSVQRDLSEGSGTNVANLPFESEYYNLGSSLALGPDAFSTDLTEKAILSYMGRVNYSFKDRYLLTLTGRYDGLSSLAPGQKWGFFPSAALAWKIHEEPFIQNLKVVDELKFRIGYGEVGNSNVPAPYMTKGTTEKRPYVWGENPAWGFIPQYPPNPDLKWERTKSLNVGLDYGVLNGRIAGTVEWYQADTEDLIMWRQLPSVSGLSMVQQNIGKVSNKGIELSLSTINVDVSDFKWSTNIIFSRNREEIVSLSTGKQDDLGNRWFIGKPITSYYDMDIIGVWQSDEVEEAKLYGKIPGQSKVKDQNTVDTDGDGKPDAPDGLINANDMVVRGSNVPDWTGSITNTLSYKGVELSFMFYTRQGSTINSGYHRPSLAGRYTEPDFVNYWTPKNPTNMYPRPNTDQERPEYGNAFLYQDGSFVKLRNVTLAYTFPSTMISRYHMSNLRVYVTAYNPILWTKFKAGDPEFYANTTRTSGGVQVPITNIDDQLIGNNLSDKSVVFGLSVGF
jgi:TonB-dependent starch-binding outer membrane protein SusC